MKLGIIRGSSSTRGNTDGILNWLLPFIKGNYQIAGPGIAPYPTELLIDQYLPAMVTKYPPQVKPWADFVRSCQGFIVVTPEYNNGYPGYLKMAMDHLFPEWKSKPVFIISFGGRGGAQCYEQLTKVLAGGLKMDVIDGIRISVPTKYIAGSTKIKGDEPFVTEHSESLKSAVSKLLLSRPFEQ
ncbi:NAD(P)H-dependent FMN reductase LOT6 [Smittium mucronatum]|uniref:NAD(P)H-dependent FMN reductase LOT6 n=1 Tax=Smittium mucronatum TaxID=133383 RepID=A0A1R0GYE6_9FUNG|nr:NAD(P)H-dependent FMN reductase LOT6 [Smittium mucronatum]